MEVRKTEKQEDTEMLSVEHVSKVFELGHQREIRAVEDLFFNMCHGERVMVVGESGCGKSTLVRMISGGQQQRVLLARSLVNHPQLLLLDEPTSGIDEQNTNEFYQLLQRLNQKRDMTILMVTHDLQSLHDLADDVWLLEDGKTRLLPHEEVPGNSSETDISSNMNTTCSVSDGRFNESEKETSAHGNL